MSKINGYTEEEAKSLIGYITEGRQKGKTLSYLFESYALSRGRAKGSVRNYYYALMKNEKADERIVKLLDGTELSVEKIREFTPEETDEAIRSILKEKSKGLSVRKAIFRIAGGDDKLTLRLQNKYRNTLKKEPERIKKIADELGVEFAVKSPEKRPQNTDKEFLRRRLEKEINGLYDRLASALKQENERLRAENEKLRKVIGNREE
jgi:hypothetical protein